MPSYRILIVCYPIKIGEKQAIYNGFNSSCGNCARNIGIFVGPVVLTLTILPANSLLSSAFHSSVNIFTENNTFSDFSKKGRITAYVYLNQVDRKKLLM